MNDQTPRQSAPIVRRDPDPYTDPDGFPFTTPATSEAHMFIQWKGTDLCMDFTCPCGYGGHVDEMFAHNVGCPSCGTIWEMGTQVIARRADRRYKDGDALVWLDGITPEIWATLDHDA